MNHEQSLLKQAITGDADVLTKCKPEHFTGSYRELYAVIHGAYLAGKVINTDTCIEAINAAGKEDLLDFFRATASCTAFYIPSQIDMLLDEHIKRCCSSAAVKLSGVGQNFTRREAEETIREIHREIVELQGEERIPEFKADLAQHYNDVVTGQSIPKLFISQKELFEIWGSLMPRFYIIGGRPSMGKSILVNNLVADLLKQGYNGLYYSWDNSIRETTLKLTAAAADVPYRGLVDGKLTEAQVARTQVCNWKGHLWITDKRPNQNELETHVDKMFRSGKKINFIVADYFTKWKIQLGRNMSPVNGYEAACDCIAKVCQQYQIPFILLSQQNKEGIAKKQGWKQPEAEEDENPYIRFGLEQLSYCDRLAQDAYHVCGLEGKRDSDEKIVNIVKDKDAGLRRVHITYNPSTGRII